MAGFGARSTAKVVLLLLLGSFVISVLLLLPAAGWAGNVLDDARTDVAQHEYGKAIDDVGHMRASVYACRLAVWLPGPLLLHFVPGIAPYRDGVATGCDLIDAVTAASLHDEVHAFAARIDGLASVSMLDMEPATVRAASAAVRAAAPDLRTAAGIVQQLAATPWPAPLGARVTAAAAALTPARVDDLAAMAAVAPPLLGLDRPRTYFVALQTPAEMRGTGGLVGQYAIVRFAAGRATIVEAGMNASLISPRVQNPEMLPGSTTLFGTTNPEWVNTNLSPHGPDAGRAWLRAWKQMRGERLDGAIALDVVAAARLAGITGGVLTRPDGSPVSGADAIAQYALNGIYFEFPVDDPAANARRKQFAAQTLSQLLAHAATSLGSVDALVQAVPTSVREGRILLYFADATLQREIAGSSLAHDIREHPTAVSVTYNNWAGNKFDYYQHLDVSARCMPGGADVRLRITNTADPKASYPAYVAARLDDPTQRQPSVYDQFLLLLPTNGTLRWLSVDGAVSNYQVVSLGDRPVVSLPLVTLAGQQHVVRFGFAGAVTSVAVQGSLPVAVDCAA